MRRTPYYEEIYKHLLKKMYQGEICQGDALGSLETLCSTYAASPNTIRTVMRRLSAEGFVESGRGKQTTIKSIVGNPDLAARELCHTAGKIIQVFDFLKILVPSIFCFSVGRFNRENYAEVYGLVDCFEKHISNVSHARHLRSVVVEYILSGNRNTIMRNIVDYIEDVLTLPRMVFDSIKPSAEELIFARTQFCHHIRLFIRKMEEGQPEQAKQAVYEFYDWDKNVAIDLIHKLASERGLPSKIEVPSVQLVDYLYNQIISDLVDQLYEGIYGPGDYLPSEGSMCEQYGVSLPTVKKAYKTLADLDVAKTMNGKGTQVTLFSNIAKPGIPMSIDMMRRLSGLMECLQLIVHTIEDVAIYAAGHMTREDIEILDHKIRNLWVERKERQIHTVPILLFELIKATESQEMIMLYQEIKKELIWSIYLDRFAEDSDKEREYRHYKCLGALMELDNGNKREFGQRLADIILEIETQYQEYLKQYAGFKSVI